MKNIRKGTRELGGINYFQNIENNEKSPKYYIFGQTEQFTT